MRHVWGIVRGAPSLVPTASLLAAALLTVSVISPGCGDGQATGGPQLNWGPASPSFSPTRVSQGPLGDWFVCRASGAEACADLDNQGVRFTAQGELVRLDASVGLEAEPVREYCEEETIGTYETAGDLVLASITGETAPATIRLAGQRAEVTFANGSRQSWQRVAPSHSVGDCPSSRPTPRLGR